MCICGNGHTTVFNSVRCYRHVYCIEMQFSIVFTSQKFARQFVSHWIFQQTFRMDNVNWSITHNVHLVYALTHTHIKTMDIRFPGYSSRMDSYKTYNTVKIYSIFELMIRTTCIQFLMAIVLLVLFLLHFIWSIFRLPIETTC